MSDVQPPRTRRNQHPGYGFRLVGPPSRRRRVVDETERQVMARIVELRKLGKSWEQIAVELLRSKVVAGTGREWSASRVRRAYFAEVRLASEELPGTKRCLSCGRVQSVDQYYSWLRRKTPDGLNTQCRECRRQKRQLTRQRARETKTKRLMTALKRRLWVPNARRSVLDYLGGEKGFVREFTKAYNAAPVGSMQQCQMVLAVGKWLLRG